jgi:sulfane dehydrogenase subunit SoxC
MRITDKPAARSSRRRFLQAGAVLAGGSAVGALGGTDTPAQAQVSENLPPNVPEWMKAPGAPTGDQLYGAPSPYEKGVVKNVSSKTLPQYLSASSRTPLQELDGIITPNGL